MAGLPVAMTDVGQSISPTSTSLLLLVTVYFVIVYFIIYNHKIYIILLYFIVEMDRGSFRKVKIEGDGLSRYI